MRALVAMATLSACAPAPVRPSASADPTASSRSALPQPQPRAGKAPPPADRAHCEYVDYTSFPERFYFARGSASLTAAQTPLLDALADTIKANPSIQQIGVAASRADGEPDTLPTDRATALTRALTDRGVDAARLESRGLLASASARAPREPIAWLVVLRINDADVRKPDNSHWLPFQRDCAASWASWRDRGTPIDCDCLERQH